MINGHGDDIHGKKIVSNFSSNICNSFDAAAFDAYLSRYMNVIHSYPEPDANSLTEQLAVRSGVKSDHVLVTNGATEAIYLIAQTFAGMRSLIITPTFSEYEDACRINKHQLSYATTLVEIGDGVDLIWLCNPNNPTGSAYDKKFLDNYISEHPSVLFIIDQSYEAFTDRKFTFTADENISHENLIVLHSLTKSYAIPGLRLGYITACEDLIKKIIAYKQPWSVNALAITAGKYLLGQETCIELSTYLSETSRFMHTLKNIKGLTVMPTNTHFFLCKLSDKKASDLKNYLINKHGILIRDASNFRGLDEHYFRLATQSPDENNNLVKAIKEWI